MAETPPKRPRSRRRNYAYYEQGSDTYNMGELPEITITGKAKNRPRAKNGRLLTAREIAHMNAVRAENPISRGLNVVSEFTGVPSAMRILSDPAGTLKGVGQTAADLAVIGTKGPMAFSSNINPITGVPYGTGLEKTLDVVGALPVVGAATRAGKSLIARASNRLGKSKFVSEIDWSKWNADTPKYPELMNEYRSIEESTKKAGTWMKYSDGTPFEGTPEQFVQMNSKNVQAYAGGKEAAEEMYKNRMYRGAKQHIDDFKNRDRSDYATFTTGDLENSASYSKTKNVYNPNITKGGSYESGIYELGIPSNTPKVVADAEGKNWRLLKFDKKIAEGTKDKNISLSHNEYLKEIASRGEGELKSYDLQQYKPGEQYLSTDIYADYVKNPANPEKVSEIRNVVDTMGGGFEKPTTVYAIDANRVPIKSLMHNVGFFDKTNPNIYRSVVPLGIGTFVAPKLVESETYPSKRKRYRRK